MSELTGHPRKFSTLHILRSRLTDSPPSVAELGRLHYTSSEIKALERAERQRYKTMAFGIIKKSTLPETRVGRGATEPRVGISEMGRIVLNSIISKAWKEKNVVKVALFYDADTRKIAILGCAKDTTIKGMNEADFFTTNPGTKSLQYSIGASAFLREHTKYDFSKAGNQSYTATLHEKFGYVIELPEVTPTPKPKTARKAKGNVSVTAAATTPAPEVTEDDIELD